MARGVPGTNDHHHRHEWRDEHIKLLQANKRTVWYRMLEWCLFMHDFDPYAVFKSEHSQKHHDSRQLAPPKRNAQVGALAEKEQTNEDENHHRLHRGSLFRVRELQMQHMSSDNFRHRTTRILRLFSIYYLIKALIISIAQHTLMRYEYLVPKNQSEPLVSLETVQMIVQYLGNPYSALKDISLMLYAGPAGFCTLCVVVLPIYYRQHRPMNIAQLRFVLDPKRELKRVDTSSRYWLTAMQSSLRVYKQRQRINYERARSLLVAPIVRTMQSYTVNTMLNYENNLSMWLDELRGREERYCKMIEKSLSEFGSDISDIGLESLRPCTFAPGYFVTLVGQVKRALLGSQAGYSLCWLVLSSSLVYSAYSNKCPRLDCLPWRVFSWPEALIIVESLFILAVTNVSSTLNATLFSMLSASQLELIKSIRAELCLCNEAIQSCIDLQSHGGPKIGINLPLDKQTSMRDEIEKLLLKSLLRLMICNRELKDTSQCISEQTLHPFYYVGGALLMAAIGAQFKSSVSDWNSLRWFIVFVTWLSFNQMAVTCANIYARLLEAERQLWTILAMGSHLFRFNNYQHLVEEENVHLSAQYILASDQDEQSNYLEKIIKSRMVTGNSCSFVANLWHKFVHSTSANVEQHCSRLFNIELNYRTIIEANFFSIFIYSLTQSPSNEKKYEPQ